MELMHSYALMHSSSAARHLSIWWSRQLYLPYVRLTYLSRMHFRVARTVHRGRAGSPPSKVVGFWEADGHMWLR